MGVTPSGTRASLYCLSYTCVAPTLPSVPLTVTVRVFPSADNTTRADPTTLPSFFSVATNVRAPRR
jgi:hypothetical protein